jgi:hypothetical protein
VRVTFVIRHVIRMRHIAICGQPGFTVFFHIISQSARFSGKKVTEHKMCFDFSATFI